MHLRPETTTYNPGQVFICCTYVVDTCYPCVLLTNMFLFILYSACCGFNTWLTFVLSCRSVEKPLIWLARAMVFLFSFQTISVKGKCASSATAPMVCAAPHSSFFDTFVFFYLQGLPSAVSKEENKKVPIISGIQCNSFITHLILTQQGCKNSKLFYLSKDKTEVNDHNVLVQR